MAVVDLVAEDRVVEDRAAADRVVEDRAAADRVMEVRVVLVGEEMEAELVQVPVVALAVEREVEDDVAKSKKVP